MRTVTWVPGSNMEMDELFDDLREQQYNDRSHRLWKNYSKKEFNFINPVALTIHFDENNIPEVCSSISGRDCWPNNAYRIHNRVWKCNNKKSFLRKVSPSMGLIAQSQTDWLKENTNCELFFISRQTTNWEDWMIEHFNKDFGFKFETDKYFYLTCPNECDDTCWQKIIYSGNTELLDTWKRRLNN
jgi:hypothetical protein